LFTSQYYGKQKHLIGSKYTLITVCNE